MKAVSERQTTESTKLFQAVGLIYGQVSFTEEQKLTVEIEGQKFKLTCWKRLLKKLINTLETNAESFLYLRVYWTLDKPKDYSRISFANRVREEGTIEMRRSIAVWTN